MRRKKTSWLLLLATLTAILTACPPADRIGVPKVGPMFEKLGINDKKKIIVSFNTNVEIVDDSKIKVEVKTASGLLFANAPVSSSRVNTGNLLELTLSTAAIHNNVYRVRLGAGALRATASQSVNTTELISSEFTYSTSPILDTANRPYILNTARPPYILNKANRPYILNNKLVATFNLSIALKDWTKVKVYKDPAGNNQEVPLAGQNIAVNSNSRNLLEITLPKAVAEAEVYRLKLEAGAVHEEGKEISGNRDITPEDLDITIKAAPTLDPDKAPYLSGQKIIVPFDGPISILDDTKIKYQLDGTIITPKATPTVINKNQLEIPLNDAPTSVQMYRIDLEGGAIIRKNTVPNIAIQPDDKDIYSTSPILNTARPHYILGNKLVANFNLSIALKDWTKVKVYKDPAGNNQEVPLAGHNIAVNSNSRNLLEITLPNTVAEAEVYRLQLEAGAVHEESRTANENKAITPEDLDITIETAPVLDADNDPYLSGQKIIVPFNGPISILDDNKIKYLLKTDGESDFGEAITPGDTPTIINKNQLSIPLNDALADGQVYRIDLAAGALSGGKNKSFMGAIRPGNKDIIVWLPNLTAPAFESKTRFNVTLPENMEIIDASKIEAEVRADSETTFSSTPVSSSRVDITNRKLLEITLSTAAADDNVYRVKVGARALRATASNLVNTTELTSGEATYFTGPILDIAPYILNNKLVATFDLPITLKKWRNVKVYKDPAGDNEEISLQREDIAVNDASRNILEITLPDAVATSEVYRLKLEARAVSEEDREASENKAITPEDLDITIKTAPVLDADNDPYLSGQKIIVPFNGPISILDDTKIKYLLKIDGESDFGAAITPGDTPRIINNNYLEIPLNDALAGIQMYRIDLKAGAITGKNTVPTVAIQPDDKDIIFWPHNLTAVKPAFESKTRFSITFPVAVVIAGDGSAINVQKKDEGDSFTTLTATSRTIEVDGTDAGKINITLTGSEEITLLTQAWKVVFPQHTVQTATSSIPNPDPLPTGEGTLILTDIRYGWKEVTTKGSKWVERSEHTSVVFKDKIWVLGGWGTGYLNDVWNSADGYNWTQVENSADWPGRALHTSVVFDNKIWVMGGHSGINILSDVWSSADGSNWIESRPPNDEDGNIVAKKTTGADANWWEARAAHSSVTFNKKIWVMGGGITSTRAFNDVWSSADGSSWTESRPPNDEDGNIVAKKTTGADANWWEPLIFLGGAVFQNKIWLTGGKGSVVWSSSDGQNWARENDFIQNNGLAYHSMVEFGGRLWNLGGRLDKGSTTNRIWSSANPTEIWTEERTLPLASEHHSAVVFGDKIWVMGGHKAKVNQNKVFVFEPVYP